MDKCLYKWVEDGVIQGVLGIHVDDVLCGGKGKSYESALERLQNRFSFGSWSNAQETTITYCGIEIAQKSDGSLFLCHERFALGIDEVVLTQEKERRHTGRNNYRREAKNATNSGVFELESHAECVMVTGTGFPLARGC